MRKAIRTQTKKFEIWQIIYIDLMTNVMIFFVILWAVGMRESKGVSNMTGTETVKMVNLPGDVLFPPSKDDLTGDGKRVFEKLFADPSGRVLNFDTGGVVKRLLVVHGHTDGDGVKEENLELGYRRAFAAYKEIRRYGNDIADHVVICSHADNSPAEDVPLFGGLLTSAETSAVRAAKAKNRR